MSVLSQARLFVERRLAFPVDDTALVLDVGSGDKPSWRANVLVDRYVGEEYAGQRSGSARARVTRPLFDADAAAMPFADGAFDYSICSNLLEHVPDPAAVLEELMRVSRAGYIEVPEAASAKIVDFPSHVWWCRMVGETFVMTAKDDRHFDPEIGAYLDRTGLDARLAKVLDSRFEDRVVMLHWTDRIDYRVEGEVPDELMAQALQMPGHPRDFSSAVVRTATDVVTARRQRQIKRRPIRYDDIVKPQLRRGDDAVLEPRVYRV